MLISTPNYLSDHCIIGSTLKINKKLLKSSNSLPASPLPTYPLKKWDAIDILNYRNALSTGPSLKLIQECLNYEPADQNQSINDIVLKCNGIMLKAAHPLGARRHSKAANSKKVKFSKKWMDKECWSLRRDLKAIARKIHQQPQLRAQFITLKSQYKKLCRKKSRE